jgi:hypothetical protein
MTIIISILSVLVILLSYASYNLMKKNEKCEDIIISYEKYITGLSSTIKTADKQLKEIDRKGSFESDDEVGFFFKQLKDLQDQLNNFKIN